MTRPSGAQDEEIRPESDSDQAILEDLLGWGNLLSSLVQILDPFYQLDDLLQTDHPLADSEKPLGVFVRNFGKGTDGAAFLSWWTGLDDSLPLFERQEQVEELLPLGLAHRWRAAELQTAVLNSFRRLDREWVIFPDRMIHSETEKEAVFSKPLSQAEWSQVDDRLPKEHRQNETEEGGVDLEDEIERVRSYFAPLESPLFGMDTDLLAHHVKETIPLEGLTEEVTPIVPLFGNGQFNKAFPSTARLPAHLRVILHRLVRSQENNDLVTSLLSTLEAVDFSLRFATGLGQGTLAELKQADFAGDFNPTTRQIISDLSAVTDFLPNHWDEPVVQASLNLLFQGRELHPFLQWAGFEGEPRLLDWMMDAEDTIRHDIPARAAALLSEMMEVFNSWISELTLLCSSWDLVTHVRQDGYLQISLARGGVWLSCKPLIDPTRYSVWLDRSELTLVNTGGTLNGFRDSSDPVESLDDRIKACEGDPPFLVEQLTNLVTAHQQGQILPLGRALFFGLEYLVRLHASLAAGFLRHFYDEVALAEPVLKEGGSLEHTIYFLSFSQRMIGELEQEEAGLLRQVFFDDQEPREFTCWLGLEGGVPGPLQGLLGWSLSLMRPDAKTRLDEVRGQVERLSSLFADFLAESRKLWQAGQLQTDSTGEGAEAVVLTFPNGLRLRGFPDVTVGPRMERGRRSVVVCGPDNSEEEFSDWEGEEYQAEETTTSEESVEEPSWPSFFDDSEPVDKESLWGSSVTEGLSRICQSRTYSGPEARPRRIAQEIADVVSEQSSEGSSVLFCQGGEGAGKTLLCRTLTNPNCSPLPEDYPVLYLRVDRFPETRLGTVVERLNDHIASEHSLAKFDWTSVPLESLKALGSEVVRLADDLSALGVSSEPLANRLASYLRQLKKINSDRSFLLILDGFAQVPRSIVPSALPPGVNLLITGTEFGEWDFPSSSYTEYRLWDLDEQPEEPFLGQLQGLAIEEPDKQKAFSKFQGSLFLAKAFRDLRLLDDSYPVSADILEDLFSLARTKFREPGGFEDFLRLLAVLGLYDRPVPLGSLQKKVSNGAVVQQAVESFPGLFSFWDEPAPSLGLGHRHLLNRLRETTPVVEAVATDLAESYLASPRRGELLAALSWFAESDQTESMVDRFFTETQSSELWRQELASLQDQGLFFHRVALLDAAAEPLDQAVQAGAGHLQEELAWVHNARGLSLLELGLVEEAIDDFERAIELFSAQFASGDLHVLQAMASAHSRLSEACLQTGDLERAVASSLRAQELLKERTLANEVENVVSELRSRVLLQSARAQLVAQDYQKVLTELSFAIPDLEKLDPEKARKLRGEYFLVAAQAMAYQGLDEQAAEQADTAVSLLMQGSTAELGLQALILRARLSQRVGKTEDAERDYQRALSILRYQVAVGRLDLEPLLAYTAAQSLLASQDSMLSAPDSLTEFVDWARTRIRQESRSDLRGLLAFLLLTRGARWKDIGDYTLAAADLRQATEQYDLLSREVREGQDQPVWTALRQSFRNLTALYLSLDEPHLALICGRRALELGRRAGAEHDSAEESLELPLQALAGPPKESDDSTDLTDVRFFQLGKLYFHLGEAARRVGLKDDGVTYFERSARSFAQTCSNFSEVPPVLVAEYALVLKFAAQAAFEDANFQSLQLWVDELASLPDGNLTDFDQYRYWRWSGHTLQAKGDLAQAQEHFDRAVTAVAALAEHPRRRSLEAESLLDLGRVLSLQGEHEGALARLDQAAHKAHDALFAEGEENRELLVLCALHSAVAHLRSGRVPTALEQLRILVSLRPGTELHEVEALAQDWAKAWHNVDSLSTMDSLKYLGQLSELGDWLLRTTLGEWYRELALSVINSVEFDNFIMSSSRIDRILETYLILTFSRLTQDTRPESNPELERLLAAKFRAFDSENRDIEAELLMGHLLPLRLTSEAGRLLLRRSEMALLRGDRGLGIIDLLRAIDAGGDCRLRAHLRLAEFLQSRGLEMAAVHHLLRALRATNSTTENLSSLSGRFSRVVTRLGKSGAQLKLGFYEEYFRVLGYLDAQQLKPPLEVSWLRPARDQRDWPILLDMTLDLIIPWQDGGHDKPDDWDFLEEVLDRTVLCQGRLTLELLEKFGRLLASTLATYDVQNRIAASALWERFATFLPALGKRDALALLQRLFEFTLRTESASKEGQADEFLRRLEEEKRILVQPR